MALILSSSDAFASTRLAVLASWASDIEGEESVCRRIRVDIKGVNIISNRHTLEDNSPDSSPPHLCPVSI